MTTSISPNINIFPQKDIFFLKTKISSSIPFSTPSPLPSSNKTYLSKYSNYISSSFTSNSLTLISTYLKHSSFPNQTTLSKILFNTIRRLTMSEMEIALYTLYIDNLYLKNVRTLPKTKLFLYIGILTKYHSTLSSEEYIRWFKQEEKELFEEYTQWRSVQGENVFSLRMINKRYNELRKGKSGQKKYYINYNKLVDEIVCVDKEDGVNDEDKSNVNQMTGITNAYTGGNYSKKGDNGDNKKDNEEFNNFDFKVLEDLKRIDVFNFTDEFISDCEDLLDFDNK